jgi:predicted site-specific integrase-resolvase
MMEKKLSNREFVTITSIGDYCMVSPASVRKWINEGKLHALKLPSGHYRVTVKDLIDFLKQNKIPFDNSLLNTN